MLFEIKIAERVAKVDLVPYSTSHNELPPGSEKYVADVEDESSPSKKKLSMAVLKKEGNMATVFVDGKSYVVRQLKRKNSSAVTFLVGNRSVHASIKGFNEHASFSFSENPSEVSSVVSNAVTSNFPAKVVKVPVKKGDHLEEDETLLVLEAMKMEARIKAPKPCTVVEVFVSEGQMIERGRPMITLEFDES